MVRICAATQTKRATPYPLAARSQPVLLPQLRLGLAGTGLPFALMGGQVLRRDGGETSEEGD
ncbi:hypothetical protein LCGC14_2825700, partial [marine sediment metagenome]